jgi:hypothetical protein
MQNVHIRRASARRGLSWQRFVQSHAFFLSTTHTNQHMAGTQITTPTDGCICTTHEHAHAHSKYSHSTHVCMRKCTHTFSRTYTYTCSIKVVEETWCAHLDAALVLLEMHNDLTLDAERTQVRLSDGYTLLPSRQVCIQT